VLIFRSFKTVLPAIRRRMVKQDKFGAGVETLHHLVVVWGISVHDKIS
jgi:hypothetical protein